MSNLKFQAERLRIGIVGGWLPVTDAVSWADAVIADTDSPPSAVLDVALARSRSRPEVAASLAAIPGRTDSIRVMRSCLAELLHWMGPDPEKGEQVARYLSTLAGTGLLPEAIFGSEPDSLEDHFSVARTGTYGNLADAHATLTEWLHTHAEDP